MPELTIGNYRLANQHIGTQRFQNPEEVVRWMGAMQAQDYHQALWAAGVRTQSATVDAVQEALAQARIIRTWPMRGTIHFIPPENARWMLKLSETRLVAADRRRQEQLGLNEAILEQCKQVFSDILSGNQVLTRAEMLQALRQAGISVDNQSGYHILWYAAQTGLICMGPMRGKEQTFVLLDEWVPAVPFLPREEALARLVEQYFISHGPATVHDFAWWSGSTLTDTRAALKSCQSKLTVETIDDVEYWRQPTAETHPTGAQEVWLLPGFDEYYLGYSQRDAVLDPEHAPKVVPGGNGIFKPILVVGSQIRGIWKRTLKKNAITINLEVFTRQNGLQEPLQAAAERYCQFMQLPLASLSIENH